MPGIAADVAAMLRERGQVHQWGTRLGLLCVMHVEPVTRPPGSGQHEETPGVRAAQPLALPGGLATVSQPTDAAHALLHAAALPSLQVVAQGAPSNADLLELWQRVAPPAPQPSRNLSRKASRLTRLLSRAGSGASAGPAGGASSRLARWLSGSSAGRSLSWLLRLPAVPAGHQAGPAGPASAEAAAAAEEEEASGRLVMEVAGDTVDVDGLTLVLSAANAAARGELEPREVRAAAQAILRRCAAAALASAGNSGYK